MRTAARGRSKEPVPDSDLLIDPRVGSREFLSLLRELGVQGAQLAEYNLPAGDFAWTGKGPDEVEVSVGVERKRVGEIVAACQGDNRLHGEQLHEMLDTYDVCYLLVEGITKPDWRDGGLMVHVKGSWRAEKVGYRHYHSMIAAIMQQSKMKLLRSGDAHETAYVIATEYELWQKEWGRHTTMRRIYAPEPEVMVKGWGMRRRAGLIEKVAAQLPGVDQKAWGVRKVWGDRVDEMVAAGVEEWMKVEGVGRKTAKVVWGALRGRGRVW